MTGVASNATVRFAVVEHHQELLVPEVIDQCLRQGSLRFLVDSEREGHCAFHQRELGER